MRGSIGAWFDGTLFNRHIYPHYDRNGSAALQTSERPPLPPEFSRLCGGGADHFVEIVKKQPDSEHGKQFPEDMNGTPGSVILR
jgi:hypothetical protein